MAGVTTQYSESSGYLPADEWGKFQQLLGPARRACAKLADQHGLSLFKDSRWPATGLELKSGVKMRYIRITLNPNYLEDKHVFFELRVHSVISVSTIYNKTISNDIVAKITAEQVVDENFIIHNILPLLSS